VDKREKVIKAFEFCLMPSNREEIENDVCSHEDCPYYREYNGGKCISAAVSDALALLKEQEPVKPLKMAVDHVRKEPVVFSYECPVCMCGLQRHWVACPICGQAVKWE
jgi:hypothetical protein